MKKTKKILKQVWLSCLCTVFCAVLFPVITPATAGPLEDFFTDSAKRLIGDVVKKAGESNQPATPAVIPGSTSPQTSPLPSPQIASPTVYPKQTINISAPRATQKVTNVPHGVDRFQPFGQKFKASKGAPQLLLTNPYLDPDHPFFQTLMHAQCSPDGGLVVAGSNTPDSEYDGFWKVAVDGSITPLHVRRGRTGNGGPCDVPFEQSSVEVTGFYSTFLLTKDGRIIVKTNMNVLEIGTDHLVRRLAGPVQSCGEGRFYPSKFTGLVDGAADIARFKEGGGPGRMAEDTDGNIWAVDQNLCALRKIAPDGQVTTVIAPNKLCAKTDKVQNGIYPVSIAWDTKNNELVAAGIFQTDDLYTLIWRIKPDGEARRVFFGSKGGHVKGAQVDGADNVAVDAQGRIYFQSKLMSVTTDTWQVLRLDEQRGTVIPITGAKLPTGYSESVEDLPHDGPADTAIFRNLRDLCFAPDGTMYNHDRGLIRRIDRNMQVSTWAY